MPPPLALFLTLAGITFLFWRDSREKPAFSRALWLPLIWYFITASRFVSQWLSMIGLPVGSTSLQDGSPIDAVAFLAMILGGLHVLSKRHVQLKVFAHQNRWIMIFLVYCLISIVWSDFPIVAFKRWFKILGHPIMALIIFTEPDPQEAVRRVLKRTAYLFIPLSVLLAKYFPQYGRAYNMWTGQEYLQGATSDKNALGHVCMIIAIFFAWNVLQAFRIRNRKAKWYELLVSAFILGWTGWLLKMSSSATSLVTTVLGVATLIVVGLPFIDKRRIGAYIIVAIMTFAAADSMFGIYANIVHGLGRNLTLTDRTNIWQIVLKLDPDPVLGVGFESFWLGDRLNAVWSTEEGQITEAHNGYLELYLDLGFVGLGILLMMLLATFRAINRDLLRRFAFGQLRLSLFIPIIVYNCTEAAFVSVHFIYAIFFLIAADYSTVKRAPRRLQQAGVTGPAGAVAATGG
jgi:exopolysaccharide production protein ExoQ